MTALSSDQVAWLYRCILNREPESSSVVEAHLNSGRSFADLRSLFISSEEFALNCIVSAIKHPTKYMSCDYPPDFSTQKPPFFVTLCTICKNEEYRIEKMLRSCAPIVDFICLTDTGSEDDTVIVARDALEVIGKPYIIDHHTFVDFADARNACLQNVPPQTDWILTLDADEYLEGEDYPALFKLLNAPSTTDAWQLPRYNFVDKERFKPARDYPDFQRRLFRHRNELPIRWAGKVHEHLCNVHKYGFAPINETAIGGSFGGPHIHHSALHDTSYERATEKLILYGRLVSS